MHIKVLMGGGRKFFMPQQTADPIFGYRNFRTQRRDHVDLIDVSKEAVHIIDVHYTFD